MLGGKNKYIHSAEPSLPNRLTKFNYMPLVVHEVCGSTYFGREGISNSGRRVPPSARVVNPRNFRRHIFWSGGYQQFGGITGHASLPPGAEWTPDTAPYPQVLKGLRTRLPTPRC